MLGTIHVLIEFENLRGKLPLVLGDYLASVTGKYGPVLNGDLN